MKALHFAVGDNRVDIAKLLVDHGANPYAESERHVTPMAMAETEEMKAILKSS